MREKIEAFWLALDQRQEKLRDKNWNDNLIAITFNSFCFDYCKKNGIPEDVMNTVIGTWSCSLIMPDRLLKKFENYDTNNNQNLDNGGRK